VCVTNEREEKVVEQNNLFRKMLYSNMKLHVSAYSGHHQVSTPLKGGLYIWVGGVDVEISMHQFPVAPIVYCK